MTGSGRVPNIFFDGTARVKLTNSDDVQIFDKDPAGGDDAGGNFDEWSPLIIYSENSIVAGSDGNFYISFISGNEGNDPTITPSAWQQIEFVNIWNTNVAYDIGNTVKASDNLFYVSLTEPNQGNDPTSSPTDWGPPFTAVVTVVGGTGITVDATDPENPIVNADNNGIVATVVGGTGVTVDATDPENPIVNADNNGTVTSVATSGLATGGPITGTGTITVAKGTGAEIDTGTEDAKAVTPKAVSDAIGSSIQAFDANTTKNDVANTFTKTQTWTKGSDVASVAALILGDGNYFDITGTATITSIGTKGVGTTIKLHFDGILTLTHNATDLILPGVANITTAAGDEAEFVEYATGDWRCVNYTRADGTAIVSSPLAGWEFVSGATASASATIEFTGMEAGYDYMLVGEHVLPATDAVVPEIHLGITGPTYRTTLYNSIGTMITSTGASGGGTITTFIPSMHPPTAVGNVEGENGQFELTIIDPVAANKTNYMVRSVWHDQTTLFITGTGGGHYTVAESHTAIRFRFASGNVSVGEFYLYRRPNV